MNAMLNGLFGPSQVLFFLETELEPVEPDDAAPLDATTSAGKRARRPDADRARLDGEPWRPQI